MYLLFCLGLNGILICCDSEMQQVSFANAPVFYFDNGDPCVVATSKSLFKSRLIALTADPGLFSYRLHGQNQFISDLARNNPAVEIGQDLQHMYLSNSRIAGLRRLIVGYPMPWFVIESNFAWGYQPVGRQRYRVYWVPLLLMVITCALPLFTTMAMSHILKRVLLAKSRCLHCGYDLCGLTSERCPECGGDRPNIKCPVVS